MEELYVDTGFSEYLLLPEGYLEQLRRSTGIQGFSKQRL